MDTLHHVSLSPEFWKTFAEKYWERKGLLLKNVSHGVIVSENVYFEAVVNACERHRALDPDSAGNLKFCVSDKLIVTNVNELLPHRGDESLCEYGKRVRRRIGRRDFMLYIRNVQRFFPPALWKQVRRFLDGLQAFVGLAGGSVDTDVFIGQYEATPRGVHRDIGSTFTFEVLGQKTYRFWPEDFFPDEAKYLGNFGSNKTQIDSVFYEKHKDDAITGEVGPGDIAYWPSSYWHVGECPRQLAAGMTVTPLLADTPTSTIVSRNAAKLVDLSLSSAEQVKSFPIPAEGSPSSRLLPPSLIRAMNIVKQSIDNRELEKSCLDTWLNRITGSGYDRTPDQLDHARLRDEDLIRGDRTLPILAVTWQQDVLLCSGNGYSVEIEAPSPNIEKIRALVVLLNGGEAHSVRDLTYRFSDLEGELGASEDMISTEDVRGLLELFFRWRAIEKLASDH